MITALDVIRTALRRDLAAKIHRLRAKHGPAPTSGYRRQRRRRGYRLFPSRRQLRSFRTDRFVAKLTGYFTLHAMRPSR
jgi:hypothetical protein